MIGKDSMADALFQGSALFACTKNVVQNLLGSIHIDEWGDT